MFLACHVRVSEWIHTLYLSECQGTQCSKQARYLKFKWLQVTKTPDIAHVSSKEFLDIQATIECGFALKRERGMIRTYSQMHRTDKYSQHSSIIWPVWLSAWVLVHELSGCRFESRCSQLNFRYRACFEQEIPWHSGNYWVWIHSETRT